MCFFKVFAWEEKYHVLVCMERHSTTGEVCLNSDTDLKLQLCSTYCRFFFLLSYQFPSQAIPQPGKSLRDEVVT